MARKRGTGLTYLAHRADSPALSTRKRSWKYDALIIKSTLQHSKRAEHGTYIHAKKYICNHWRVFIQLYSSLISTLSYLFEGRSHGKYWIGLEDFLDWESFVQIFFIESLWYRFRSWVFNQFVICRQRSDKRQDRTSRGKKQASLRNTDPGNFM